ncbi:hypothetical protein XI03_37810 [Bradyrhizobium sp. CCBAU 65884]|nr:hypothetical protein [Bradyrhizobium sp. CCBAU 65884]
MSENSSLPGLIFGMLSRATDAVVVRIHVVRFRRLEFVRNCERQKRQRKQAEARRSLQQREGSEHSSVGNFKLLKYVV